MTSCTFAPFKGIQEDCWSRLNWWIMSQFHSDGQKSCITEEALWTWTPFHHPSRTCRRWKGQERRTTNSSPHTTRPLLETKQRFYRGRETCTTVANGSLTRTPSAASTWPGLKKKDCSLGRQGLTPSALSSQKARALLFTTQCPPTVPKKWYAFQETEFSLKGFPRLVQLRRSCWRTLGRWSKANYQATRNRLRRATSSKLISAFKESHKVQYLKIKEEWPRFENLWSSRFSEEFKKTVQKLRKARITWIVRSYQENTWPVVRQVLARGTVLLHMRNMFNMRSFRKSVRDLVHPTREAQSMDLPEGNMIIKKRKIQSEMHWIKNHDGKGGTEILKLLLDGQRTIVDISIQQRQWTSHLPRQKSKRSRYEVNHTLGVNDQGPKPGPYRPDSHGQFNRLQP